MDKKRADPPKKADPSTRPQSITTSHRDEFFGTGNPRHLRAINALMNGPVSREQLDQVAAVSNGPDIIMDLRLLGLNIPCERIRKRDIDGRTVRPGIYFFTEADKRKVEQWRQQRAQA